MGILLQFPNGERGASRPASASASASAAAQLLRRPIREAAAWQADVMTESRRQPHLVPELFAFLQRAGLMDRCLFLAADGPDDPMRFRYIGAPSRAFFGRVWAREMLGRPEQDDPHQILARQFAAEYMEAVEGGAPVLNRVTISGLSAAPLFYQHALIGWRDCAGRRAVLSAMHVLPTSGHA